MLLNNLSKSLKGSEHGHVPQQSVRGQTTAYTKCWSRALCLQSSALFLYESSYITSSHIEELLHFQMWIVLCHCPCHPTPTVHLSEALRSLASSFFSCHSLCLECPLLSPCLAQTPLLLRLPFLLQPRAWCPLVPSSKVIPVLSFQPGSEQWDSVEETLGLGVRSSALSLISASSWAATSEPLFPLWQNSDNHLSLDNVTRLFEGQIWLCGGKSIGNDSAYAKIHALSL